MTEFTVETLVERLGDGKPLPSPAELLAELGVGDPQLGRLLQLVAERQAAQAEVDVLDDETEEVEPGEVGPGEAATATGEENSSLVHALDEEVDALRRRNDALAAGLGACYLCWGEDAGCPACRGRGRPGARRPEPAAYERLVAPAARRMARERAPSRSTTDVETAIDQLDAPDKGGSGA